MRRWAIAVSLGLVLSPRSTDAAAVGYDKVVAVVVGVSDYQASDGFRKLPNAREDAVGFAKVLRDRKFSGTKPIVLTLYNRRATESAIIDTFEDGLQAAQVNKGEHSLLIFYFAGHGGAGRAGNGYIVPYGAKNASKYIMMSTLQDLAGPDNGVSHQLFILGSCFSGALLRSETPKVEELPRHADGARWLQSQLSRRVRAAILAGSDREVLPDGPPGAKSRFGRAVIDALSVRPGRRGRSNADYDGDGCVTQLELATYVQNHGAVRGVHTPFLARLAYDDTGAGVGFCRVLEAAALESVDGRRRSEHLVESRKAGATAVDDLKPPHRMAAVPMGVFFMGCSETIDKTCVADEKPGRLVDVPAFFVDRTEVTVAD